MKNITQQPIKIRGVSFGECQANLESLFNYLQTVTEENNRAKMLLASAPNQYDPNAVRVAYRLPNSNVMEIGWIPKELSEEVSSNKYYIDYYGVHKYAHDDGTVFSCFIQLKSKPSSTN